MDICPGLLVRVADLTLLRCLQRVQAPTPPPAPHWQPPHGAGPGSIPPVQAKTVLSTLTRVPLTPTSSPSARPFSSAVRIYLGTGDSSHGPCCFHARAAAVSGLDRGLLHGPSIPGSGCILLWGQNHQPQCQRQDGLLVHSLPVGQQGAWPKAVPGAQASQFQARDAAMPLAFSGEMVLSYHVPGRRQSWNISAWFQSPCSLSGRFPMSLREKPKSIQCPQVLPHVTFPTGSVLPCYDFLWPCWPPGWSPNTSDTLLPHSLRTGCLPDLSAQLAFSRA